MWTVVLELEDLQAIHRGLTDGACKRWATGQLSLWMGETVRDMDTLRRLETEGGYHITCNFYVGDVDELTKVDVQ